VKRLYQSIGLNSRQIQMLAMAIPKRSSSYYYYTSPLGRRLITLGLGPVALGFAGMTGREAILNTNELIATRRESRPAEWLDARGLPQAAEAWHRVAQREGMQ